MARGEKTQGTDASAEEQTGAGFPVVGIGASAGGLEALEQLFRGIGADAGMAFVVVQHLDPGHESLLAEILQRTTALPVQEAQDQMAVERNRIYVIPPNRELAIFHGKLQLSRLQQPRGQHMRIDGFFRSLADDQGERAVGILLSGTGTDGTLGLRAILGAGGVSLVQEPGSAKYDGMPQSAIRAGYATRVLPPDRMWEALRGDGRTLTAAAAVVPPRPPAALSRILLLLRSTTGHDFSQYKKSTITRRIERRMAQNDVDNVDVYLRFLKETPEEVQTLFKDLLINVTSFFRDPEAFETLKREILPGLLADRPEDYVFRVWVAGCATGEEAYSIAILLREVMDETHAHVRTQIYSTDLDEEAITLARNASYPPNIGQDVSPERLRRFFVRTEGGYRVKKEIREMVVFAVQNVIKDPPFTKLDLLSCRNLMIYLEAELQERLIPTFHYALRPGGVLFLSPSESVGNHPDLFSPLNRRWKLYRAAPAEAAGRALLPAQMVAAASTAKVPETGRPAADTGFAELTRRALLAAFAPASVLTDSRGALLYVFGETGKLLRPAPGHATLNVVDMAREELQAPLRAALHAAAQGVPTVRREIAFKIEGSVHAVKLSVRPLPETVPQGTLLLVSFEEMASAPPDLAADAARPLPSRQRRRVDALERELAYTKENLQAIIEAQQASNEEMQSTNEEMQSTNEELQATNEELETSREELQSVNEELITVNAELQSKIEQLTGIQNDMKNLLDNVTVGSIFLDQRLAIRRFTREATRVYRLLAADVGRPLADINSELLDDDLLIRAGAVLDTLIPYEREMRTGAGGWYLARIQPYRTLDNVIDGVVLTFTDITGRVDAENSIREAREFAEAIVDTVREPLLVLDGALQVVSGNRAFYRYFQVMPDQILGRNLYDLGDRQWNLPPLRDLLEKVLPLDSTFDGYIVDGEFPGLGHRRLILNARRLAGSGDRTKLILLAFEDAAIHEQPFGRQ